MDGYWSSNDGRRRAFERRRFRAARAIVLQEPRRKGRGPAGESIAFRAAVREQTAHMEVWPRPRAILAVDLHFSTSARQPPQLWNLPKNYLDLLGETSVPASDAGPVLYSDDRSIRMLYASCRHGWDPDASEPARSAIAVIARTRADALADMALAWRVSSGDIGPEFGLHDDTEVDALDLSGEELCTADELEKRGDADSLYIAAYLRHRVRERRQDLLLRGNDAWLTTVFCGGGHRLLTGSDPRARKLSRLAPTAEGHRALAASWETSSDYRRAFLTGLNYLTLPGLPTSAGDTRLFRQAVDNICADFVSQHPSLFPLVVPLRVSVLVVPPRRSARNAKDLDNVIIDVLSSVDRHFKPPLNPWLLGPVSDDEKASAGRRDVSAWKRKGLARLKSLGETSIWAYQILELQRHDDDPPAGALMLVLGHGMHHRSLWENADDYLTQYFDGNSGFLD